MKNFTTRFVRLLPWWVVLPSVVARAEVPPELAAALHNLEDQHSYSWEFINGDPGMAAEQIQTQNGPVTAIRQSLAPHVLGSLTSAGDALLQCDWPDGLQMDVLVAASGELVTRTPEGWMTSREVLDALADEQVHNDAPTPRYQWLKRADRPNTRRPDQELAVLLKGEREFAVSGDAYITRIALLAAGQKSAGDGDAPPVMLTYTLHVSNGVLRTYEIKVDFTRATSRAHIQVAASDDRLVVLTYLPVTKLDVPDEAWARLKPAR